LKLLRRFSTVIQLHQRLGRDAPQVVFTSSGRSGNEMPGGKSQIMEADPSFFSLREGGFLVEAMLQRLGGDYLVSIWGGAAHIGAVAMAQPRPSIAEPSRLSATASVFCYVGHKEDEVVKRVSEQLAAGLDARVVVVAGLHWDDLDPAGIEQIMKNIGSLIDKILSAARKRASHE